MEATRETEIRFSFVTTVSFLLFHFVVEWPRMMMDDDECGAKPAAVPLCAPQIPHDLGSNQGRGGGKPATNHRSYFEQQS
jgi:hypothetical protein